MSTQDLHLEGVPADVLNAAWPGMQAALAAINQHFDPFALYQALGNDWQKFNRLLFDLVQAVREAP